MRYLKLVLIFGLFYLTGFSQGSVSIDINPNPTRNHLNFTLKDNSNSLRLEIFDISGKRIKFKEYFNHSNEEFNGSLDVSELKNGIYFYRISNEKKEVFRKFIKQ